MPWSIRRERPLRVIALVIFLVSLLGPWSYDVINVPAKYDCSPPNVRLEGDYCGLPLSGMRILVWIGLGVIGQLFAPAANSYISLLNSLVILFLIVPILPLISNGLMLVKQGSRSLQVSNLVFWGIACVLAVTMLVFSLDAQASRVWGLLSYAGLALGMMLIEGFLFMRKSRQKSNSHQI